MEKGNGHVRFFVLESILKPVPPMPRYRPIKFSWWEKWSDRLSARWQDFRERLGSKIARKEVDEDKD